jgi:hypothetical protein
MKKVISLFSFLILFYSCQKPSDCIESTGEIVTREYVSVPFSKIYVYKGVGLIVKQGNEWKVEVTSGGNLFDKISIEFKNNELHLKDNSTCNWVRAYGQIKVTVTTPQLAELDIISKTEQDIVSEGILTHNILRLISIDLTEGAGTNDFKFDVNNYQVVVENNNVSRYYLKGTTQQALFNLYDGHGRIEAENLIVGNIKAFHRGSNDMIVHPVDSIVGKMVSTGNIILKNIPTKVAVEELYQGRVIYP